MSKKNTAPKGDKTTVSNTKTDERVTGEGRELGFVPTGDDLTEAAHTFVDSLSTMLTMERVKKVSGENQHGEEEEREEIVNSLGFTLGSVAETIVWKLDQAALGPEKPTASNTIGIMNPCNKFGLPMLQQDLQRTMGRMQRGEDVSDILDIITSRIEAAQERLAATLAVRDAIDLACRDLLDRHYRPLRRRGDKMDTKATGVSAEQQAKLDALAARTAQLVG